jgi:hypothetical protein
MEKIENFSFVQMSCRLALIALTELSHLTKERPRAQIQIVKSHTFQYYRISMQYMFVMEFTKLLEADTKDRKFRKEEKWEDYENQNFSSLQKLSRRIKDSLGLDFSSKHEENKQIIGEIRDSEFYKYMKALRNREFGHTDAKGKDPLNITSITRDNIEEAFKMMDKIKCVLDNCTSEYGYEFFFDYQDTRTDNFIAYHALYKSYYDKHLNPAIKEGFHIEPKI